jgi:Zn-dependent protease with chaperone function
MSVAAIATLLALASVPVVYVVTRGALHLLRSQAHASAGARANAQFLRGVAPTLLAVAAALGVVLPSFLTFERPHDGEPVGLPLLVLATVGAVQAGLVIARAIVILWSSSSWIRAWSLRGHPLPNGSWGMPAMLVDAVFPVVAVAGILRPRLFIDRRVYEACSPGELAAIGAHERAHVRGRDNLRRLLLGAFEGTSSRAASEWRHAAEIAADERAADSPQRAVELASAILKVARLAPASALEGTALSTIHDGACLDARVRRLITPHTAAVRHTAPFGVLAISVPLALTIGFNWMSLMRLAYTGLEAFVRLR